MYIPSISRVPLFCSRTLAMDWLILLKLAVTLVDIFISSSFDLVCLKIYHKLKQVINDPIHKITWISLPYPQDYCKRVLLCFLNWQLIDTAHWLSWNKKKTKNNASKHVDLQTNTEMHSEDSSTGFWRG
jgi:hypothetical protein